MWILGPEWEPGLRLRGPVEGGLDKLSLASVIRFCSEQLSIVVLRFGGGQGCFLGSDIE